MTSTKNRRRRLSAILRPDFLRGLLSYTKVPAALTRHRLWPYQLLPAVISLVLSTAMVVAIYWLSRDLAGWVDERIRVPFEWLDATVTWVAGILAFAAMVVAFLFLQKHIVIVLLAPFLSRIAEKITRAEAGAQADTVMPGLATVKRSAIINTRSVMFELAITLALLILGMVVPLISPLTTIMILLVESRFAGNGLMDFPLEYRGFSVRDSVLWSRKYKGTATGVGAGYLLLMLIPIVGWMFAPTFGTVAGTLRSLQDLEDHGNEDKHD